MAALSESLSLDEIINDEQELILRIKQLNEEEELIMKMIEDNDLRHNHHRQKGFFEYDISR